MINDVFALMIEAAARADAALRSAVWTVVLAASLLMPVAVTVNPRLQFLPAPSVPMPIGTVTDIATEPFSPTRPFPPPP